MTDTKTLDRAVEFLSKRSELHPRVGMILGSGLGELAGEMEHASAFPYEEIPGFAAAGVEGHAGRLHLGRLGGRAVQLMQGRYHLYEGHDPEKLVFPVQLMAASGCKILIVTNASGGVNPAFSPGDLALITDHINFLGDNPLIGPNNPKLGPRFPDMSEAYSRELRGRARERAQREDIELREGVYLATTGPSYETPAEIRMFRAWGADMVGMSTVPEVIAANHAGLDVLGISCVTNMAAGIQETPLRHEEVIETTERVKDEFKRLVRSILPDLPYSPPGG